MIKATLSEICSIQSGGTPSRGAESYWGGSIPWAKISDLEASGDGYISDTEEYITEEGLKAIRGRIFDDGTLLFAMYGSVGKTAIVKGSISTNQAILGIKPEANRLDLSYLKFWLRSQQAKFDQDAQGVAQKNLSAGYVRALEIPLPPLSEQKRIAAILDKADAIRRKRQQAIQFAGDLLRAVFEDMFGDPVTNPKGFTPSRLGDLCEDLFLGLTSKVDYIDGVNGYPLVRAKDINTGELNFEGVKYISKAQHQKLTRYHLTRKGDLLVSKSGTLGTCALVRTDREFSTYESIFTVRPIESRLNVFYLIHLLQNKGFKEKLVGNKVGGTVAHLNLKMFRDFEIGVPPISLQNEFSLQILKCESKLEKYRKSRFDGEYLFNSLCQKAFSGQL